MKRLDRFYLNGVLVGWVNKIHLGGKYFEVVAAPDYEYRIILFENNESGTNVLAQLWPSGKDCFLLSPRWYFADYRFGRDFKNKEECVVAIIEAAERWLAEQSEKALSEAVG